MIDYEKYKLNGELPFWALLFKKVEKILEPALEYDKTYNIEDVADCILNGTMQLWPTNNSAVADFPKDESPAYIFGWWQSKRARNANPPYSEVR